MINFLFPPVASSIGHKGLISGTPKLEAGGVAAPSILFQGEQEVPFRLSPFSDGQYICRSHYFSF